MADTSYLHIIERWNVHLKQCFVQWIYHNLGEIARGNLSNCFAESIGKISSDLNTQNHRCGGAHHEHHHFSKRKCSEIFCILTIWKQLPRNGFERSGRGQEPSRGHKFSISENFLSIRDFTSSMRLHFRSDLVGACLPQTLLRADEEELCQFDTIPPTIEKTERSRRGTLCFTYCYCLWLLAGCVLFRGAPCFCFEKKLEK